MRRQTTVDGKPRTHLFGLGSLEVTVRGGNASRGSGDNLVFLLFAG